MIFNAILIRLRYTITVSLLTLKSNIVEKLPQYESELAIITNNIFHVLEKSVERLPPFLMCRQKWT